MSKEEAFTFLEHKVWLQGTNGRGDNMAIFSRKQSAKKVDEQAKVTPEGPAEAKPAEGDPTAAEAKATEAEPAKEALANGAGGEAAAKTESSDAKAAEAAVAAPVHNEASQEVAEPEPMTPPVQAVEKRFGIDDAVQLMRSLPSDPNMSLVVRVVRVTLGAVHVSIDEIIADALRKEARIRENIVALESQVGDLEKQLTTLRRDIATQQAELKETANVRERLHMADQYPGKAMPPPISSAAIPRLTPSKPVPTQS